MLRQTGRYRTLERDLMDLQERKLFEYFIVVALHKTKAGVPYLPEVTQQFPLKVRPHWAGWYPAPLDSQMKDTGFDPPLVRTLIYRQP